ncbi:MAG: DUF2935 domain-containing protein [Oscillospiraceae bacterium]
MLRDEEYIRLSMENNLFWTRIMKEHAVFIESSMPAPQKQLAMQAAQFKQQFERLLGESIRLANGVVSRASLQSHQYFTQFTEAAEQVTQQFTGVQIQSDLTRREYDVQPMGALSSVQEKAQRVSAFNRKVLCTVKDFARFKSELYELQASCEMFTFLYTSVYKHIFLEAQRYMQILNGLLSREENYDPDYVSFWNHQMSDHAKVMRGLFDPSEAGHFDTADQFAKRFDTLIRTPSKAEALTAAKAIAGFKADTTREILECKVKSIMSPLFTDHILREANYYIYLLQT